MLELIVLQVAFYSHDEEGKITGQTSCSRIREEDLLIDPPLLM